MKTINKLILDAGHGWETPGKRSIFHKSNKKAKLKENNFNEAICNKMSCLIHNSVFITPEWWDVSLAERVQREHNEYRDDSLFMSIHADAYKVKDSAHGGRFYYYSHSGKEYAEHFTNVLVSNNYPIGLRPVKQANFYVLKNTKSPAILFEAGFMTSETDLNYLLDDKFRNDLARLLKEAYMML